MKQRLEEILQKMNNINYGYVNNNKIYLSEDENWETNFYKNYHLASPEELLKTKYGVCWDQVELERYFLELEKIDSKSYFIIKDSEETHTFLVVKDNNKYYWLEHSWYLYKGLHEYNSLNELLNDVKEKFKKDFTNYNNIFIYEYNKPKYNISCDEFMTHCLNSKLIIKD